MRFRTPRKAPPYLNRRDQWRMLAMVAVLMLVVVAIQTTADPQFWAWMFPPEAAEPQEEDAGHRGKEPIDFGVQDEDEPLPPDVFRSPAAPPQGVARDGAEFDRALLRPVRDNTLGIRHDERDAYYLLLAKARDIPLSELERAAADDVAFRLLMTESERFRGRPITVEGEVRRLLSFPAGDNDHGIERLYELWMFTADSGNNPYRIVCTSLPDGIPQGEQLAQPVRLRVTGYFFKREGYASQGGLHTAPLLLAKRPRWLQAATPAGGSRQDTALVRYLAGFVMFVALALGLTVWRFTVADRKFERQHLKRLTQAPHEAIAGLEDLETVDPGEALRRLAEEEIGRLTPPGPPYQREE